MSALTLSACVTVTPIAITRIEGGTFRACSVDTSWTEAELLEQCGAPALRLRSLNRDQGECLVFESLTRARTPGVQVELGGGERSRIAVCLYSAERKSTAGGREIAAVWSLDAGQDLTPAPTSVQP